VHRSYRKGRHHRRLAVDLAPLFVWLRSKLKKSAPAPELVKAVK